MENLLPAVNSGVRLNDLWVQQMGVNGSPVHRSDAVELVC